MTFKEKLAKEKPQYVSDTNWGGCVGCPGSHWSEYISIASRTCEGGPSEANCEKCWNQEIPEENEKKEETDMKPIKFKKDSDKKPTYAIIEIPEGYGRIMSFTLTGTDSEGLNVFTASYDLTKGTMVRLDKDALEAGRIEYIQE